MEEREQNLVDQPIKWGEKTLEAIQQLIEENKQYRLQEFIKSDQ